MSVPHQQVTRPPRQECLTAAVLDERAVADRQATLARAQQLVEQGLAAFESGKDAVARDLLRKALIEDPSRAAAYQALGTVCEKQKDEDGVVATYRDWIKSGAKTPLPYNRVGEILEKRKDYRAALEAYVRSLQVEWNQPPIIEARKRLEKLLAN
jgi:Tfp pilus assembly protein PilF